MAILYGGTFDPPTIAHEAIIAKLSEITDEVIIVPNGEDYKLKNSSDFKTRVAMIKLITDNYPNVRLSLHEKSREFVGTVETLRDFNHPTLAIGSDCLANLSTWINAKKLVEENTFIVFTRDDEVDDLEKIIENDALLYLYKDHFTLIKLSFPNVSSSLYKKTKDPTLVPKAVYQYILLHKLY